MELKLSVERVRVKDKSGALVAIVSHSHGIFIAEFEREKEGVLSRVVVMIGPSGKLECPIAGAIPAHELEKYEGAARLIKQKFMELYQ